MPYLRIQTNLVLDNDARQSLLPQASALLAQGLGKPEAYIMVSLAPTQVMLFAGSDAPCAYLALKSIGLPANKTAELSATLCQWLERELKIPAKRIYIEFADVARSYWGWDNTTFG